MSTQAEWDPARRAGGVVSRRRSLPWRAGWSLLALLVLAALLGLAGPVALERNEASTPDGRLTIEYERFASRRQPTRLRFRIDATETDAEVGRMWIDHHYLNCVEVERITPEPAHVYPVERGHVFEFPHGGARSIDVAFDVAPRYSGTLGLRAGIFDGPEIVIAQFVAP